METGLFQLLSFRESITLCGMLRITHTHTHTYTHTHPRTHSLDFPGRGKSPGKQLKTRSEFNLIRDGACDVVRSVINDALGRKSAILVGYDWGAGVALSMASSRLHRKFVTQIVAFHPSFNVKDQKMLTSIDSRVLLLWCKHDQFHSWTKFKKHAETLSKSLGVERFEKHIFEEREYGKYYWRRHKKDLERRIVKFLTRCDPIVEIGCDVFKRPEIETTNTNGTRIMKKVNVVFEEDVREGKYDRECIETRDMKRDAVRDFRIAMKDSTLSELYDAYVESSSLKKREARKLFSNLPILSPTTMRDPSLVLVSSGLWSRVPCGWNAMKHSERYFVGRTHVLVRANVCPQIDSPNFLCHDSDQKRMYTTWRTKIVKKNKSGCGYQVQIPSSSSSSILYDVSEKEMRRLNHSHTFPVIKNKRYIFEDGLYIEYESSLVRAKLAEIAIELDRKILSRLDFDAGDVHNVQCEAVEIMRRCVNMNTFQDSDGDRSRDRSRYCGDDIGRFLIRGQGHCHTVSSVFAAVLFAFSSVLGIDVKYRGGFTFYGGKDKCVQDSPERHQWLEFTCRPSMRTYTCDLYAEDGPSGGKGYYLHAPIQETYLTYMYPNGKLCKFSSDAAVRILDDEDEDGLSFSKK